MNLKEAINAMLDGKKVRLPGWMRERAYCYFEQGKGFIFVNSSGESSEKHFASPCNISEAWETAPQYTKFSDVPVGAAFRYCNSEYVKVLELFKPHRANAIPLSWCDKQSLYFLPDSEVSYELRH